MEHQQINGVLFDAFGTLCHIESPRFPYRSIMKRWPQGAADCYQAIMTREAPLAEFAGQAGLSWAEIELMEANLAEEIRSMRLFSEVSQTLRTLLQHGVKIAVVSNLATPYGAPCRALLPVEPDVLALSYEVGSRKPDAAIYRHAWEKLGCAPEELLMVGDSLQNDYQAPMALGIQALWLDRKQTAQPGDNGHVINALDGILGYLGIA